MESKREIELLQQIIDLQKAIIDLQNQNQRLKDSIPPVQYVPYIQPYPTQPQKWDWTTTDAPVITVGDTSTTVSATLNLESPALEDISVYHRKLVDAMRNLEDKKLGK